MWWIYIASAVAWSICAVAAYRRGVVKGRREGKFKWRCPECKKLMIADNPQEILHGSLDHMKGHFDAQ